MFWLRYIFEINQQIPTMAMETILVSTAMLLLLVYILKGYRGRQNQSSWGSIPRVSPCLPYFGNALQLNMAKCHLCLSELRQKYGPVFCIRLFKEDILVLNDSTSIREALILKGSDYAGRPPMYRTSHAERNKHSIVWQTYTQKLVFLRKSVTKSLRMYGSGLQNLEGYCEPDIRQMCERLARTEGQAFDPWNIIYDSVCSIMLYLVGNRPNFPLFSESRTHYELGIRVTA